ncbi:MULTISPECIES: hypothetical protein [Bacteroidaceae]|uniref:hypothetical protein n=1 Tax=Bacteroidaceae TaxID=815 RepID=UPI001E369E1C|nr:MULTISPECIES: hypothetical protein [Bacteroidaceae]MDC2255498.1 hypothetical protein [Bacteroides thetaiotaomicron]
METALQRIIRKTGRTPVECRCPLCRQQCRTPCLGTPEDVHFSGTAYTGCTPSDSNLR